MEHARFQVQVFYQERVIEAKEEGQAILEEMNQEIGTALDPVLLDKLNQASKAYNDFVEESAIQEESLKREIESLPPNSPKRSDLQQRLQIIQGETAAKVGPLKIAMDQAEKEFNSAAMGTSGVVGGYGKIETENNIKENPFPRWLRRALQQNFGLKYCWYNFSYFRNFETDWEAEDFDVLLQKFKIHWAETRPDLKKYLDCLKIMNMDSDRAAVAQESF